MPAKTQFDKQAEERLARVIAFQDGRLPAGNSKAPSRVKRVIDGKSYEADFSFLGSRAPRAGHKLNPAWQSKKDRYIGSSKDAGKIIDPEKTYFSFKSGEDYIGTYYGVNGLIRPEYDMQEPFAIFDTEVYVKQAVNRKLALMFRNGYEIISDRPDDAEYIQGRIDTMEYVTNRSFRNLLRGVLFNLLLCSNCFLYKIRRPDAVNVPQKEGRKAPVAGYSIIPAHTMLPWMVDGRVTKWHRIFDTGRPYLEIDVDDVIHLTWDRKSPHLFGTPRTIAVRDDIFALRRLEENIELLFINHLFPLFHVKIGTEKAPCTYSKDGGSEIDLVKWQIENMPKEGVFVTDERTEVEAVGAEGKSLSYHEFISHYKARIFTGLGVSAIDMGEGADATMATADNISQNLKDAIKADLDEFSEAFRLQVFKEWFLEANYSTSVQKATARTSLTFHEVDMDNRIKEENHVMNLFNNHLYTEDEARKRMRKKPIDDKMRKGLHYSLHVTDLVKVTEQARTKGQKDLADHNAEIQKEMIPLETEAQEKLLKAQTKHTQAQAAAAETKAGAHETKLAAEAKHMPKIAAAKVKIAKAANRGGRPQSATGKKTTQNSKLTQNKTTPTNQHGSNPSPTKAKSSRENFLSELYLDLTSARQRMMADGLTSGEAWKRISANVLDSTLARLEASENDVEDGNYYTRQAREGSARMKDMIAQTSDPEMLAILLDHGFSVDDDITDSQYEEDSYEHVELHANADSGVERPEDDPCLDPAAPGDSAERADEQPRNDSDPAGSGGEGTAS